MYVHLILAAAPAKPAESSGIDWGMVATIAVPILTVLGFGGKIIEYSKSKPRLGVTPRLYDRNKVTVEIAAFGNPPLYVTAATVVAIKSRVFRAARKPHFDDVISPLTMEAIGLTAKASDGAPQTGEVTLKDQYLLPARWNPFRKMKTRKWRRRQCRLEVAISGRSPQYMRFRRKKGDLVDKAVQSQTPREELGEPRISPLSNPVSRARDPEDSPGTLPPR